MSCLQLRKAPEEMAGRRACERRPDTPAPRGATLTPPSRVDGNAGPWQRGGQRQLLPVRLGAGGLTTTFFPFLSSSLFLRTEDRGPAARHGILG